MQHPISRPTLNFLLGFLGLFLAATAGGCVRASEIVAVATNPSAETAGRILMNRAAGYAANPKALARDIEEFRNAFQVVLETFRQDAGEKWGPKNVEEPEPKRYVKYTQSYLSRAMVDFNAGRIVVETVDQTDPAGALTRAVAAVVLTPDDPRGVDLYSAEPVPIGEEPFLFGEVVDFNGRPMRWQEQADTFAGRLVATSLRSRTVQAGRESKTVHSVSFPMVSDHLSLRAAKYQPLVNRYASRFHISPNLVFAIIKVESAFNPYAASSAPAFGLMQIVPTTAGSDVREYLDGKPGLPSPQFLFNPDNNIRYGTAYLSLLDTRYLAGVTDPLSREYCVISGYNGGAGSVLRTFSQNRQSALDRINQQAPSQIYQALTTNHPYRETRRYLQKVLQAQKSFVGAGQ